VHVFDGHVAAHKSIGSNALDGIAFSADGATLWVTGARKGQPAGLTGYRVE
jgi:sugar lactone lactonase YvrE